MLDTVIAIHGGAGAIARAELTPAREAEIRAVLIAALDAGHDVLHHGGVSIDAVEQAVRVMEDSPLFNAGRGAVFTAGGSIELDACIMDGRALRAGAVAAVRYVRNPITLARAVMDHTPHVLLAGEGAEAFARARGAELMPESYFHTEERWNALQRVRKSSVAAATDQDRHGTVGAVALDRAGNLAAATSTGGMTNKLPGRVGDSPIVGAGTYADSRVGVSATGDGEVFVRCNAAYRVAALMELGGRNARDAARRALQEVTHRGGRGGMIVLDRKGEVAMPFTTLGMYRGLRRGRGKAAVGIYRRKEAPL